MTSFTFKSDRRDGEDESPPPKPEGRKPRTVEERNGEFLQSLVNANREFVSAMRNKYPDEKPHPDAINAVAQFHHFANVVAKVSREGNQYALHELWRMLRPHLKRALGPLHGTDAQVLMTLIIVFDTFIAATGDLNRMSEIAADLYAMCGVGPMPQDNGDTPWADVLNHMVQKGESGDAGMVMKEGGNA